MIHELEDSILHLKGPYTGLTPQVKVEDIPSHWKPYPKGSEILLRKYTGLELRYFSDSILSPEKEMDFILDGIQTIGFDKDDLTWHDYKYLGLQRRLISLDSADFSITWFCDKCGNTVSSQVKASNLEFDDISVPSLPMNVKLSFGTYKFFPMTIGGYKLMQKTDREEDSNPELERIKVWMFLMSFHIQDLSIQPQLYQDMITKSSEKDIRLLEEVDKRLYHSIMPVNVICPSMEMEVKPESGFNLTYDEILSGGLSELVSFAEKKGISIPDNISFDDQKVLEYIDSKLGLLDKTPCNNKSRVRLSSGSENLILPFRGSTESMDDCITFG